MKFPINFFIFFLISVLLTLLFLAICYLLNPIFATDLTNIAGLVYVFLGAATISKGIFEHLYDKVKKSYENNVPPWFYRFFVVIFLNFSEIIEEGGCSYLFKVYKNFKKFRDEDPNSPLRGVIWVGFGTILQIISFLL